ncbi:MULTISPECIES: TetR/AcrR family transcriptional regulator [Streptomyces]|uniref:TetR/AcrR family transcriptional regulator n=1 Tax=Streptomyces sudanensis TaxID=436397 RepID=A0ABY4TFJ3_9ACTN|nr:MULTISPECIES: TetR/AcrR family transcriptional regulator [Streptomyces]MCP9956453.1 TetR/AcrR family transcriptional regulator [Streptomyces sudanensis]MCQ0002934.1 TetR/AcrR family transcriptional regulator [Streptomyces sudanensis]URN17697.1 TetR/AcrR family transcriptional regulator [Streptomyces sudanensis]
MGRPRTFDEAEVVRAAAELFARRAYDGVSVDDLVAHLGVHRNSLYKVFGSKRGLYLAALRWHLEHRVRPLLARVRRSSDPAGALEDLAVSPDRGADLDLLLLALAERAPVDPEVAGEVAGVLRDLDAAVAPAPGAAAPSGGAAARPAHPPTATALGLRLRLRAAAGPEGAPSDPVHPPRG